MNGNVHKELQKAVYKITTDSLLAPLSEKHKLFLLHKHWHQPDPNGYTEGQNLPLIEVLINDACFFSMASPKFPLSTKFSIGNIKLFTGLESEEVLSTYVHEINEIWQKEKLAKIEYENQTLKFEIILKTNS